MPPNGLIKVGSPLYGSTSDGLLKGGSGVYITPGSNIYYYLQPAQNIISTSIISRFTNVRVNTSTSATFINDTDTTYTSNTTGFVTAMRFTFNDVIDVPYIQNIDVNVSGADYTVFNHPVPYDPFTKYTSLFSNGITDFNANTQYYTVSCSVLPGTDTSIIQYSNATMDSNITFTVPNVYNVFTCSNLHSYSITSNSTILKSFQTSPVTTSVGSLQIPTGSNLITYHGYLLGAVSDLTFYGNTSVYIDGSPIVPHSDISSNQLKTINIYGDSTTTIITDINNQLYFRNPFSNIDTSNAPTVGNTAITVTGSIVNVPGGLYTIHSSYYTPLYFDNIQTSDGGIVQIYDNTTNTTAFKMVYNSIPPVVTITHMDTGVTYDINDICRTITPIELPAFIGSNTATATYKTYLL